MLDPDQSSPMATHLPCGAIRDSGQSKFSGMSTADLAAALSMRRDETVQVALLLAFAGGYLDAYTWIVHGVMANAQTANLVLLWVYGTAGERAPAPPFAPPPCAFIGGVLGRAWQRRAAGELARASTTVLQNFL